MKIHFEGMYKELLRVYKTYLDSIDYCILKSGTINPKGNNTKYWCLDLEVIPNELYDQVITKHDDETEIKHDSIFDSLPVSCQKKDRDLLEELIDYIVYGEWDTLDSIIEKAENIKNNLEINDEDWLMFELDYHGDETAEEEEEWEK